MFSGSFPSVILGQSHSAAAEARRNSSPKSWSSAFPAPAEERGVSHVSPVNVEIVFKGLKTSFVYGAYRKQSPCRCGEISIASEWLNLGASTWNGDGLVESH